MRAFNWCIDKGMALYWGTSEWPSYLITEAMNVANRLQLIAPITEVYILTCITKFYTLTFALKQFPFASLLNIIC